MLENYTITNVNSNIVIKCNRCGSEIVINKITNNIVNIHDSYDIVVQFLLLNDFRITTSDKCVLINAMQNISVSIDIDEYHIIDNVGIYRVFNNSGELLEYLKEKLDVYSINKIAKNE